jgi:hypothetical protein
MTRDEAKLILCAWTPDAAEADPGYFADALALLDGDPDLQRWWQTQQAFDRRVADQLAQVPPPFGLRTRIAANAQPRAGLFGLPRWGMAGLGAVAAVLLLAVAAWRPWAPHPMPFTAYTDAALASVQQDPPLPMMTPDRQAIVDWLGAHRSPTGDEMPGPLATMPAVGCMTLDLHGHRVSLICFTVRGTLAHLFIIDTKALDDSGPMPLTMAQHGEWATAAWGDGSRRYLLASRAGMDALKSIL